jgi:hypothetical protein
MRLRWWLAVARTCGLFLLVMSANWMAQAWSRFGGDPMLLGAATVALFIGLFFATFPDWVENDEEKEH